MGIVDEILKVEEKTPIMVHSICSMLGERVHLFRRVGDNVKIENSLIYDTYNLTGDSLYGITSHILSIGIKYELFEKGNGSIWVPGIKSKNLQFFEYSIGSNNVRNYLDKLDINILPKINTQRNNI